MVTLYVEGGGDGAALKAACRRGFSEFLGNAGVRSKPRIVACGTRRHACERFCLAVEAGDTAYLLVDSEAAIAPKYQKDGKDRWLPWRHLKERQGDGWYKPSTAENRHCHLMVQCMESWFIADAATLGRFFGQGFLPNQLPTAANGVEDIPKTDVYRALKAATKDCRTKAPSAKATILSSSFPSSTRRW